MLELRRAQVKPAGIDELLHDGVEQHGNVEVFVDVFPDAGGAHALIICGQGKQDELPADHIRKRAHGDALRAFIPHEDDVVVARRAAGQPGAVRGGVADHVAPRDEEKLPPWEERCKARQIVRHGEVHRDVIRKKEHIRKVRDGHADDLPPEQAWERALAPGEFIHRQVDLEAARADLPHDALMPGGERIECAGEEGGGAQRRELERAEGDLAFGHKAVKVVEHRRLVIEVKPPFPRFRKEGAQLLDHAREAGAPRRERHIVVVEEIAAQNAERGGVDRRVIMGDACEQQAEDAFRVLWIERVPSVDGDGIKDHAESADGGAGSLHVRAAQERLEHVHTFVELLLRQAADEPPHAGGDEARDLALPGFELPQQVDDDLVALIYGKVLCYAHEDLPRVFAHGKVLADAEQVGKVHGDVERVRAACGRMGRKRVDLYELDRPMHGVFEVAQIKFGNV